MKFNKTLKLVVGAVSIWPFIYTILSSILFVFWGIFNTEMLDNIEDSPMFFALIIIHLFSMFGMMLAMMACFVHLATSAFISKEKKIVWALLLFFGQMFTLPFYWYFYIWREPVSET